MQRYVAFLRGINVGGHKLVKNTELQKLFEGLGLKNVAVFIQSGNVLFDLSASKLEAFQKKLEAALKEHFSADVGVGLRSLEHLRSLVKLNPFKKAPVDKDIKWYVTFFLSQPLKLPKLPLQGAKKEYEIFLQKGSEAFWIARRIPGKAVFPLPLFEKEWGTSATIRNWNTVRKLAESVKPAST